MQTVRVTDPEGEPLPGVELTIYFGDTGAPILCSEYHDDSEGVYCILTDRYVRELDTAGRPVHVGFEKAGYRSRLEIYLFNTDPCQCHINLLDGDTRIALETQSQIAASRHGKPSSPNPGRQFHTR